jgi:hypothetical protein
MPEDSATIDYFVRDLMATNPTIMALTYMNDNGNIIYQTSNWDISSDTISVLNAWRQQTPSVVVQGIKYSVLQCTPERLVSTNILGQGHIVASSERSRVLLAYVTPDGGAGVAYMDVARVLSQIAGGGTPGAPGAPAAPAPPTAQRAPAMPQPTYQQPQQMQEPQQMQQPQQYQEQPTYTQSAAPETGQRQSIPKSTWTSAAPDSDMKSIIWELEEFIRRVESGEFYKFLRNILTIGDQVKLWEALKLIRHFKSLMELG